MTIKAIYCVRRLPQLSREEFQHYWLHVHGPLVLSVQADLRLERYIQSHTLLGQDVHNSLRVARGAPPPFDGLAELWWTSQDELELGMSLPEGRAAGRILLEDERRFIDLANSPIWWATEHEVLSASDANN